MFAGKRLKDWLRSSLGVALSRLPRSRALKRNGLTVFIFHSVSTNPGPFEAAFDMSVTPDLFKKQLEWILGNYTPVSPQDLDRSNPLPSDACLLTFDDGWPGVFQHVYPLLEEKRVPSLLFLNTEPLDGTLLWAAIAFWLETYHPEFKTWMQHHRGNHKRHPAIDLTPELLRLWEREKGPLDLKRIRDYQGPFASWKEIKEWDGHPLVFYGNHLFNHWNATSLTNDELQDAFRKNQTKLDQLRSGTRDFAFTFGTFLPHQPQLLFDWGASRLYTSRYCVNSLASRPMILGRIHITSWHDRASRLLWETNRSLLKGLLPKFGVGIAGSGRAPHEMRQTMKTRVLCEKVHWLPHP